jgi:Spy/CpxP family protein refolding chaperone
MLTRLIGFCLLLAGATWAQAPRGMFAWWDSPLVGDLNLSPDQARQIRQNVREYRVRLLELRAAVERAELDLEQAFNAETVDQQKANELIEKLIAARSELTRTVSQMSLKLRTVLTPEQWQRLQQRRTDPERPAPGGLRRRPNVPSFQKQP